ncbi:MAG: hypothetical protein DRR42_16165 [Gammaproteobacteria bacterium]|nr:MAG: hypothetical protein DRR42_16165 [Gammaproteobacteria bacterium]
MHSKASVKICRACGNVNGNKAVSVKEMNYGLRKVFQYFECSSCLSLQIQEIPSNLSTYYPDGYLTVSGGKQIGTVQSKVKRYLLQKRSLHLLGKGDLLGGVLHHLRGDGFRYDWEWLQKAEADFGSRILDVGCGPGYLIQALMEQGFYNCFGLDRFQMQILPGVRVQLGELRDLTETFDYVMLHHSFEHMENPVEVFGELARIMAPGATLLIRTPVANCYAWRTYGPDWYQIDAPRHIFIPSVKAMNILADRAGLEISNVTYDSDRDQILCSEQYQIDIPLRDERSVYGRGASEFCTSEELHLADKLADELNCKEDGDQAAFYLKRKG